MPKIVILDSYAANPGDISWKSIEALGELMLYDRTSQDQVIERSEKAEVVIVNKTTLTGTHIEQLPNLKLICLLATGMDNVDVATAKTLNIEVRNAKGYGTMAVAQHAFALILELTNHVGLHNRSVQQMEWTNNPDWCYWINGITELKGKTLGIYGLGAIGTALIKMAEAFEMKIAVTSSHANPAEYPNWKLVDLEELFTISDVISLHSPLTAHNKGIVDYQMLAKMKPHALLINTGRGALVVEKDLRKALVEGLLAGAGIDVLTKEPPLADHPLLGLKNCIVTPHNAWAARESRERLVGIVADNIKNFYQR